MLRWIKWAFFFAISFVCVDIQAQSWLGAPFIDHFSPKDYKNQPQNWCIEKGADDKLYFGNNDGILSFDGERWDFFDTENQTPVFHLALSPTGDLYYGADSEFGVVRHDSTGRPFCEALFLDTNFQLGWFHHLHFEGEELIAVADYGLVRQSAGNEKILNTDFQIFGLISIRSELYLGDGKTQIYRLTKDSLVMHTSDFPSLQDQVVLGEISFTDSLSVLITRDALFKVNRGMPIRFYTELDFLFEEFAITDVCFDREFNLLVALDGYGIVRIDQNGKYLESIQREDGLLDLNIKGLYLDDLGSLWATSFNGIFKINSRLGLKSFGNRFGLHGSVETIYLDDDLLLIGTVDGVFMLKQNEIRSHLDLKNHQIEVQHFDQLTMECWSILKHPKKTNTAICAMNTGLYELNLRSGDFRLVYECYPWTMRYDSTGNVLILGLDPGLAVLDLNGYEKLSYLDIDIPITSITQNSEGRLFCSSVASGFFELLPAGGKHSWSELKKIELLTSGKLEGSAMVIDALGEDIVLGTDSGLYRFQMQDKRLEYLGELGRLNKESYIHRVHCDAKGRIWIAMADSADKIATGLVDLKTGDFVHEMFTPTQSAITQSINHDQFGNIWIGNLNGVFVYNENNFETALASKTKVRALKILGRNKRYAGPKVNDLPNFYFNENDIEIQYSSFHLMEENAHYYEYRLKGLDNAWSDVDPAASARFTNLAPGDYSFEVRSINMYGKESTSAAIDFRILPPWYETGWYYAAQAAFFILLILVTLYYSRGSQSQVSEVLILITVITLFEFVILALEPQVEQYANGVPLFKLVMNILLALSLSPIERWLRRVFKRQTKDQKN